MRQFSFVLFFALFSANAFADEPAFVTGRPGNTESPIAVPPGHWQIETEIASYAHDKQDGVETNSTSIAATDFRYGIAHGWDAELIVQPYLHQSVKAGGMKGSASGVGDVTLRTRRTLMGQDGDGPALAVIGFVSFPTSQNGLDDDKVEGGAIITGSTALTKNLSLTGTAGAATISDGAGGREGEYSAGTNLTYALNDKAGVYGEIFGVRDQHDTKTAATLDFGATYLTSPTTQLDAGVNLGITDSADDCEVFVGWSHRF